MARDMSKDTAQVLNGIWWAAFVICIATGVAFKFYFLAWAVFALGWIVFLLSRSGESRQSEGDQPQETTGQPQKSQAANVQRCDRREVQ